MACNALEHGLKGDGETNDQPALAALVDELGRACTRDGRPRVIHCPPGVYRIAGATTAWRSGISLTGAGEGAARAGRVARRGPRRDERCGTARHAAQPRARTACGGLGEPSATPNREATALALAVQPTDAWRELWIFRKSKAGGKVRIVPPAAVNPGVGYAEFAGWARAGRMRIAREALADGKLIRKIIPGRSPSPVVAALD